VTNAGARLGGQPHVQHSEPFGSQTDRHARTPAQLDSTDPSGLSTVGHPGFALVDPLLAQRRPLVGVERAEQLLAVAHQQQVDRLDLLGCGQEAAGHIQQPKRRAGTELADQLPTLGM
jgi:hypothetical protein